ncbi:MAG: FAD-dependent oxidoreductase [Bacteroidales bacterium]|nr:FAD-dependent oxidoreductase [Lentimicrobiaceae bacterium]MDD5693786.1 FAD-dependent oxidoreductase [Bacteroidales bacterium]
MNEDLNIILNGKILKGRYGETILELAQRHGLHIPTLCHDPRLEPYTSCFLCVVEIEGFRGLQPSCSTRISEGMKVTTDNEKIRSARRTALNLLVSDHYADCIGPCKEACPAGVDVQGYISLIEKGMYHEAVALIKETNPLPAVCGRVCVRPCEVACRRNLLNEGHAVGIDYLKRFASDYDLESPDKWRPGIKAPTGKKVAVIGAGPAGLSCGFFLQKEGHQVDLYEAAPKAGGWLQYGIPDYRLPNDILQKEVDNITEMGVRIFFNQKLGGNLSFKDLKTKYDAAIIAIGSQKGTNIGCEGDDAINVLSGIDFLKKMELSGERLDFTGKRVAVIGGGNTAMDCCRTARRCGSKEVIVIYRRTEKEMPANPIEIHESKLENVTYMLLTNPTRINKDSRGKVHSITCQKMQLGEPDRSGRRRPVPVEGSEFDLRVDYILAAIGQKTDVSFLNDINQYYDQDELKLNRWGDIDADPITLQTGIPSIFAAGDGVSGPATLIQAIGQARLASQSCHLFLMNKPLEPLKPEFLSKKESFKAQVPSDYDSRYVPQAREEMPTLVPAERMNFKEVELGYANEKVALHETQRCLECGCVEYFTCDLKRYCTEYEADQVSFKGDFTDHPVDFRHPYIEIDSNKCILCSRCIRICREVVGANALGLVNRGFNTYVAPSMGDALQDTTCESCGLCISTCPTGAITENVPFKPGPVKLHQAETICNYCSVGCKITLNHKNGFVMKITGAEGQINPEGNLCRYAKFGYHYINDRSRITRPLYRENGKFQEIGFDDAFQLIKDHIRSVKPDENAFFAGARLSNEELYLIQKLARAAASTNNVCSFHYLNRGQGYTFTSSHNVPFEQITGASKIYLIGAELNIDNAEVGFMINQAQYRYHIPVELVTVHPKSTMIHKADSVLHIKSYYHFIRAVNYYLVANGFENRLFIDDQCEGFDQYKQQLMKENFMELLDASGVAIMDMVIEFAREINLEMNAVIVFSEKECCADTASEIYNLALLTGKLGKTSNGIITLKEKNNSQGLIDMGIAPEIGMGGIPIHDRDLHRRLKEKWHVRSIPRSVNDLYDLLENAHLKNLFIFGEDPLGSACNKVKVAGWLSMADFILVQDYFMTKTAAQAHLILPASLPFESGGSFTNTQRMIQTFEKVLKSPVRYASYQQLGHILSGFGLSGFSSLEDIRLEALTLLKVPAEMERLTFHTVTREAGTRMFHHGCDIVNRRFDEDFNRALSPNGLFTGESCLIRS